MSCTTDLIARAPTPLFRTVWKPPPLRMQPTFLWFRCAPPSSHEIVAAMPNSTATLKMVKEGCVRTSCTSEGRLHRRTVDELLWAASLSQSHPRLARQGGHGRRSPAARAQVLHALRLLHCTGLPANITSLRVRLDPGLDPSSASRADARTCKQCICSHSPYARPIPSDRLTSLPM